MTQRQAALGLLLGGGVTVIVGVALIPSAFAIPLAIVIAGIGLILLGWFATPESTT